MAVLYFVNCLSLFLVLFCFAQRPFHHYKRLTVMTAKSATITASGWLLIYLTFDSLTWAKHTEIMRSKHWKFIRSKCIFLWNSWQNDKATQFGHSLCARRVCSACVCGHRTKGSNFNWIQMPAAWAPWTAANTLAHFQFSGIRSVGRSVVRSSVLFRCILKFRYPPAINSNKLDWRWLDRP